MTVSLTSLEVVLELIWHPTTKEGWTVRAVTEGQTSPSGLTVTDEEVAALHRFGESFPGEGNSTITPHAC